MTITDYAFSLILGPKLEDKLAPPPRDLADIFDRRCASLLPERPAREPSIQLGRGRPFPAASSFGEDRQRASALHAFMNHELLAVELMALALLRFPEAPPAFRLGLVQTIAEEQSHCRMYLQRLRELGLEVGEAELSGFFWDALNGLDSPLAFVSAMSLTLEQANLDFALHFRDLFRQQGDERSAAILQRVHDEEIGHVKFGWHWMQRLKPSGMSPWECFIRELRFPLSPARARGLGDFDRAGRLAAGLDEDFITAVELASASRGRSPDITVFNAACEDLLLHGSVTRAGELTSRSFAPLMAALVHSDDIVLCPLPPDQAMLGLWRQAGLSLPRFLGEHELSAVLENELPGRLRPWASTPELIPLQRQLQRRHAKLHPPPPATPWPWTAAFSKTMLPEFFAELAQPLQPLPAGLTLDLQPPRVCHELAELTRTCAEWPRTLIKTPMACAGRAQLRPGRELTETDRRWVKRQLAVAGSLVLEPLRRLAMEFSTLAHIEEDGAVRIIGQTILLCHGDGRHRGNLCGKLGSLLPAPLRPLLLQGRRQLLREYAEPCAHAVGRKLAALGLRGPFGLDGYLWLDDAGQLHLRPLSEINPRCTMGRLALEWHRRLAAPDTAMILEFSRRPCPDREPASWRRDTSGRLLEAELRMSPHGSPLHATAIFLAHADAAGQITIPPNPSP